MSAVLPPGRSRVLAESIHHLGIRALGELIEEIICRHPDLAERVEAYGRLRPEVLRALGAHEYPPALFQIGGGR